MQLIQLKRKLATSVFLALTALAATSAVVRAEEIVCAGTLGAVTVDNLQVPANATCSLNGTSVKGTIIVERGATLSATAVSVGGNIQAEGAAAIAVGAASAKVLAHVTGSSQGGATVGGSIQIRQSGAATLNAVSVGGDIHLEANFGLLEAAYNQAHGNLQVVNNTGAVRIVGNIVDGNLQCQANSTAPVGGGNTVSGRSEDQCAQLDAGRLFLPSITR